MRRPATSISWMAVIEKTDRLLWVGYEHSSRSEATRHKFLGAIATSNDAGFPTRKAAKSRSVDS